jgi:hypothetical protein
MCGVGIGMGRRMQEGAIHADRHPEAAVFCAAAIGTTEARGAPIAAATSRATATTAALGSVV